MIWGSSFYLLLMEKIACAPNVIAGVPTPQKAQEVQIATRNHQATTFEVGGQSGGLFQ